jgi:hypothetical protein
MRPPYTGGDADRPRNRARLAARHAEQLYPGALGRLVAHELVTYGEAAARSRGDLAESVIAEVLDRTPPRAAGLVRSSELGGGCAPADLRDRHHRRHDAAHPDGAAARVERSAGRDGCTRAQGSGQGHTGRRSVEIGTRVG